MASIQSYLLKRYLRIAKSLIVRREKHKDIPFLRRGMAITATRVKPPDNVAIEHFSIGKLPAALFTPRQANQSRIFLYLHGGGYAVGSIKTHTSLIAKIAQTTGMCALAIDYRLAPEHTYPAALDDSINAYNWLLEQGYLPENIAIMGDSAGGGLTLCTLLALRDRQMPMPAVGVCMSPWTDLTGTSKTVRTKDDDDPMLKSSELPVWGRNFAGEAGVTYPLVSPLYADLYDLPPLLIQVGTSEILEDDSIHFADKAKKMGVPVKLEVWEDMIHVWQFFWFILPEAEQAIQNISKFITRYIGKSNTTNPLLPNPILN